MFGFIFDFIAMLDWFLCIYIAAYVMFCFCKGLYYYFYFYHCMTLVSLSIFEVYIFSILYVCICVLLIQWLLFLWVCDCCFCFCSWEFFLLLLAVCCRNIESNTQKKVQNIQPSILFSSQCFLFGERVLYVVVVRGFLLFFIVPKPKPNKRNLVITGVKCSFLD